MSSTRTLALALLCYYCCCWLTVMRAASVDLTTARCHPKSSVLNMLSSECICEPCDLCFFKFVTWECRSLADDSVTDVLVPYADDLFGLDQPLLHPDDWFLTANELTRSRGGVPRDDLQVFSTRNRVQLFSATDQFFASVYSNIEALDDEDAQVFLTGWSLANVPFHPKRHDWQRTTLQTLFGRAMQRGVSVRALVWANILERAQNVAIQHWLNSFQAVSTRNGTSGDSSSGNTSANSSSRNASRGLLLFDDRLPHATSSHHQKTLVLSRSSGAVIAYVGGIDLTTDRWDTRMHNNSRLRRLRQIARHYDGWVDASLRLEGRAALDVAANFIARWNAPQPPLQRRDEILAFDNPPRSATDARVSLPAPRPRRSAATAPTPSEDDSDDGGAGNSLGTASVQIVRTFSCQPQYEFAPRGELSLLHARLKAIARAQNFVYVEDQYFIHVPALQAALLRQLPRLRALVVVTQRPTLATAAVGYGKLLFDMLTPLTAQFPDKVHVFTIEPALELYIHTKAVLIDDVFLSIGSGNWNKRSMTSDSEIAANVVDRAAVRETPDGIAVNALAREFRLAKFSEFTGRSVAELDAMTLLESVHALELATRLASSLVSKLEVVHEAYFDLFPSELEDVIDPFDECPQ